MKRIRKTRGKEMWGWGGGGGVEGRGSYGVWWGDLKEINHLKDLGVDGNKILKVDLQEVGWEGTDWNDLVQNRDRRRTLVNTVMNLPFP